ncbi:EamA family transporter [Bacillus mycoides]|uniref:EamA family transporter n=1 Tax=Bacillus mycoides TaxID=1405 RepID=UPI000A27D8E6|nr:EamA family transporter [Bacillus mycoides]OSX87977.1 hypothetical protein BTJ44_03654 [Bacillus mycoides]
MNSYMLLLIFGIILANYSQILLKKATLQQYDSKIKEYVNTYVIIGYSIFVLNAGLNIIVLKGLEVNQVSALESLSYIIILIFGWYFLGETITKRKVIGNIIILIGVVVYCIQ